MDFIIVEFQKILRYYLGYRFNGSKLTRANMVDFRQARLPYNCHFRHQAATFYFINSGKTVVLDV